MIMQTPRIIVSRLHAKPMLFAILWIAMPTVSAESHTRPFPEINLIRGKTLAGHPYLNGGISFDEQRVMERAAAPYNLKLIFATRLGTPATPAFIVIGANDRRHIEKITLRAPWFFIQLPAGGYTILARFQREMLLMRNVNITAQPARSYFLRGD
jgi:hypothetical protein